MMTIGRLARTAALAGMATLLIPMAALAQKTWTVSSADAAPGSEVVLNLTLSDTSGVAGANLTVKLDNNDVLSFHKYDGVNIANKADSAINSWAKEENKVSDTELRVVAYSLANPPAALGAASDVALFQVHFMVKAAAAPDATATVRLDAGVDSSVTPNVGLTRLSDASGNSSTPAVVDGTVTIVQPVFPPVAYDFSGGQGDWTVLQVRETFDASANPAVKVVSPGVAIGLKVVKANDTFGFYTSPVSAIPAADTDKVLMRANWTLSSSASEPADCPAFRLRFNASDYSVAELLEVQSPNSVLGGRVAPGNTPKVISQYFMQSASARNTVGAKGYQASFDIEAFDPNYTGPADSIVWLRNLEVKGATIDDSSPTPVSAFNYDFTASGSDAQGWLGIAPPMLYGLDGFGFANTMVAEANNGLILRSVNTPHNPPVYQFSLGIWMSPEIAGLTGSAASLYRLKMTIASTTANPVQTPHFRVRLNSADQQWVRHYEVIRKDIDPAMAPDPAGTDYYVYFNYPVELNGVGVRVSLDQINERPEDDASGSFKLMKASLDSITMPTYN